MLARKPRAAMDTRPLPSHTGDLRRAPADRDPARHPSRPVGGSPPQRGAPADPPAPATTGPAERYDAAAGLQLAEPHIVGGDHDVGGQRQLDRQG